MLKTLLACVRLTRPPLLVGGVVLYAVGAAVAYSQGYNIQWGPYVVGQIFVISLQWMAYCLNDYWDYEADRPNPARTWFSGGSGVLIESGVPRELALYCAWVSAALALATGVFLLGPLGAPLSAWAIMLLGSLGAYFYSAPPMPLARSGYGELSASVLLAGLVPAFSHLLQTERPALLIVFATAPLVVLHLAFRLLCEWPSLTSDALAGKKMLFARLGLNASLTLHNGLIGLAFVLAAISPLLGVPTRVALSLAITAPLAAWQVLSVQRLQRAEPVAPHALTGGAALLFYLASYLVGFSFWVIR